MLLIQHLYWSAASNDTEQSEEYGQQIKAKVIEHNS